MRVITISTSGSIQDQTWDHQAFHMWRLGRADGPVRTATSLDLGLEIWSVADDETGGLNHLAAELTEGLREPSAADFHAPYVGDMVITARERSGLTDGQVQLLMRQFESILASAHESPAV